MKKLLLSVLMLALSGCATCGEGAKTAKSGAVDGVEAVCPVACKNMNCPPPGGTYKLCCPVAPYNQTCP